jgi:hypothetical protein
MRCLQSDLKTNVIDKILASKNFPQKYRMAEKLSNFEIDPMDLFKKENEYLSYHTVDEFIVERLQETHPY